MKTIHKFPFEIKDEQTLGLPAEFKVVHVGLDPEDTPCIWLLLDPAAIRYYTKIILTETGQPIPAKVNRHLGTFVQKPFVWHVFIA